MNAQREIELAESVLKSRLWYITDFELRELMEVACSRRNTLIDQYKELCKQNSTERYDFLIAQIKDYTVKAGHIYYENCKRRGARPKWDFIDCNFIPRVNSKGETKPKQKSKLKFEVIQAKLKKWSKLYLQKNLKRFN